MNGHVELKEDTIDWLREHKGDWDSYDDVVRRLLVAAEREDVILEVLRGHAPPQSDT